MNLAIFTALLLCGTVAHAYDCPPKMSAPEENARAWLESWRGTHEMPNCRVEISVCTPGGSNESGGVVAEILITRHDGREAYVPISLTDEEKIETQMNLRPTILWYLKRDKYYETEMGRTETSRLEITTDGTQIKSVDLGMYATKKRLRGPSKSRWFNCGFRAE